MRAHCSAIVLIALSACAGGQPAPHSRSASYGAPPSVTSQVPAKRDSIATRNGVTVDVELQVPSGAAALVLLFDGAGGNLSAGSMGFAQHAHKVLADKGIATALVDAPSDQTSFRGGMHPQFRMSEEHVADIDAVVESLRSRTGLPIWVLGVSLGSRSAANYAVRRTDRIDGVVLISSSTNNPGGRPVDAFPLQEVTVPLLAVAHQDDQCPGTPPAGAQRIAAAATRSPAAVAKIFTGGSNSGKQPCGLRTYHTFYGIEDQVVTEVAEFIADHTS